MMVAFGFSIFFRIKDNMYRLDIYDSMATRMDFSQSRPLGVMVK